MSSSPHLIRFELFEVDTRSGELRRQGSKVNLQDQPFQALVLLLERPGEVVTREELRKRLWPENTFVDFERGLNKAINKLRAALRDDAEKPRFIETLPQHGYRFIAPLEGALPASVPDSAHQDAPAVNQEAVDLMVEKPAAEIPESSGARPQLRTLWLALVACAFLVALFVGFDAGGWRQRFLGRPDPSGIRSLAVLPLENLSHDLEQEYFADGMTEALTTELAQISALKVISRTSVMQYKGTKKSLPQIAKELRVDAVIEGAVQRSGNKVEITVQLIHAPSDRHLWAKSYERDLRDVLSLQDEVTRAIVSEIRMKITSPEQERLSKTRPIDPEAYQFYLKGHYYLYKLTPEGLQKAIEYFQQAIDKDPSYAQAYAGLAETYNSLSFLTVLPPRTVMPKAKTAAVKALEIDDRLAEAHGSLGWASFTYDWDWPAAAKEFERAVALNPGYPHAHVLYSFYFGALGRSEEALAEVKRARDLDPASPAIENIIAVQLYLARQFDQTIQQCRKTQEMDPNFPSTYWVLGDAYAAKGMYREALVEYEKYAAFIPGNPLALAYVGYAHARLGERNRALRGLEQLRAASTQRYVPAVSYALVYVGLGEKEQAFTWLEKACEERTNFLAYLKVHAIWDPLRSDPRFKDLLRRVGLSQ